MLTSFFDYMFYRLYMWRKKKQDVLADEVALNYVAMLHMLILLDLGSIVRVFYSFEAPPSGKYVFGLPVILAIWYYNYYRYMKRFKSNNYADLHMKWKDESKESKARRFRFLLIYVLMSAVGIPALAITLSKLLH